MKLFTALLASAVLALAPTASANPARELTDAGIPGALVYSSGGKVHAAGNARPHHRFRAGSVSKTFVATAVLQLVAEGRLSLDQRVHGVPLRTLLNHTSGIFNHTEDPRVFEQGLLKRWQPRELIAISDSHPPYFAPGTDFHYSNTGYVILGELVGDQVSRRIIRPLGLKRTRFDVGPRVRGVAPGVAAGEDVTVQDTSWAGAAGALVSTPRELARFYRALLSGRLLGRSQLAAMKTIDPVTKFYGLGLARIGLSCGFVWGHDGQVPGYNTFAVSSEDGRRQTVVMAGQNPLSEAQQRAVLRVLDEEHCA